MKGDLYTVFYTRFDEPGTHIARNSPFDYASNARTERDNVFRSDERIQSVWIMVTNRSLNLAPRKYGYTQTRGMAKHQMRQVKTI